MLGFPSSALSDKKAIDPYWRRGTVKGYQAYVRVQGHDRTATPARPTKTPKGNTLSKQNYLIHRGCPALPPFDEAVEIIKSMQRPTQQQLGAPKPPRFTVDPNVPEWD